MFTCFLCFGGPTALAVCKLSNCLFQSISVSKSKMHIISYFFTFPVKTEIVTDQSAVNTFLTLKILLFTFI
jgi:hypothetical protein